jgi:hypothetical protein
MRDLYIYNRRIENGLGNRRGKRERKRRRFQYLETKF